MKFKEIALWTAVSLQLGAIGFVAAGEAKHAVPLIVLGLGLTALGMLKK